MVDSLVLGWKIDSSGHPTYWLDKDAKQGRQSDEDLIKIPGDKLANHTVIIAQSGSGKSFFLGRLMEELLLHTKARCLMLDPNGDFNLVDSVADSIWEKKHYDEKNGIGFFSHETEMKEFTDKWKAISKRVRTQLPRQNTLDVKLKIWWPSLSAEFIGEDLDSFQMSKLYHCHEFVRAIGTLANFKALREKKQINIIELAEQLGDLYLRHGGEIFSDRLDKEFNFLKKIDELPDKHVILESIGFITRQFITEYISELFVKIESSLKYVTRDIFDFYFAGAHEYQINGIIYDAPYVIDENTLPRLDVVNLSSTSSHRTKALVVNSILKDEWERARNTWEEALINREKGEKRIPLFIIVEEAHNLISSDAENKSVIALREQFRTIAAEGRKYGIFLIIVSQRPDKLDSLVLSECANKAIMRIDSRDVVKIVQEKLGFQKDSELEKTLEFKKGRILLSGKWSDQTMFVAARRTVQGGTDLNPEYWATP